MVSRPSNANLGGKHPKYLFKLANISFVDKKIGLGRAWIAVGREIEARAEGGQEEAKEGQTRTN